MRDASRNGVTPSQFDGKSRGVTAYRALLKHLLSYAPQITSKPQLALQSYLDGLLQDATEFEEVPEASAPALEQAPSDEFAAAVREEQARDARRPVETRPYAAHAARSAYGAAA